MTMIKLYGPDKREMMQVASLERDGSVLVVKGKIFGTMPMTARLNPEDPTRIQAVELPERFRLLLC